MNTFFRYWLLTGVTVLIASGIYALTLLPTTDTIGSTVLGIIVAFAGAAGLILCSIRAGVFTATK